MKFSPVPSRFLNLTNTFEFSGWGTLTRTKFDSATISKGEEDLQNIRRRRTLGQFTASALAGNAVLGSVFYALPAVVVVSSVFSPLTLFVASLVIFLWRPIMEELASALPIGGAPYTYLLNVSSKPLALFGAALLLLDFASTSVVSAATAMSYLAGEVHLPFPVFVGSIIVLVVFALISLAGLRESARIAFVVLSFHIATILVMFIASIIAWAHTGNAQIRENWNTTISENRTPSGIAQEIFNGLCLSVLGLTGFECTPSYVSNIKGGDFPKVLRNMHIPAIFLSSLSMLFSFALLPMETILGGANVLSELGDIAAGKWLRQWIVVDAFIVLCGGVLTGILGASALCEQLARDRLLPQIFLTTLPLTRAPVVTIVWFTIFGCILYATSGFQLSVISNMFTLVWLMVMTLFPLSALLLKFNRGRLSRSPRTPLSIIFLTFAVAFTVTGGNIALNPAIVGYAAAYLIVIAGIFYATMKKATITRWLFWIYDQTTFLHGYWWSKGWGEKLNNLLRAMRRQPVCVLVKTDEINRLFHKLLYVSHNEETSCMKLVHFYNEEEGIPSEMEANWKILDEAFPEITVDLVLVNARFNPANVAALSHPLEIPTTLMFMSCPGPNFPYPIGDFGTRIISM
ncbi:amino acid permease-domain-containing protein [Abortiporus biennis]|nr:amino acid permease-domain-containing protein [Abortiporus biennis]